jgi:signal transduction histidine kinase
MSRSSAAIATMTTAARILILAPAGDDQATLRRALAAAGVPVAEGDPADPGEALARLRDDDVDCVVLPLPDTGDLAATGKLARALANAMRRAPAETEAGAGRARDTETELERAVRARDEVLAVVSHDLRNPLNTILVATDVLRIGTLTEEQRREHLATVKRSVKRAERLIQDLLDVTGVETGRLSIAPRAHDPGAIVRCAVADHEAIAAARPVALVAEVADAVPPARIDRDRALQVLANLLSNALRVTPQGGRVVVRAEPRGDEVLLSVSDTGPGIPPEHLSHIFDRFWQARSQRRGGAGLGLAVARGIVESHGGRIWAENVPTGGARVCFTVPRAE